jgi:hypothetical protein
MLEKRRDGRIALEPIVGLRAKLHGHRCYGDRERSPLAAPGGAYEGQCGQQPK